MFADVDESAPQIVAAESSTPEMKGGFTDKLELPSGFRPYGFKELYIRAMTVDEVKRMQPILKGSATGLRLADALAGCTNVRLDSLTYGDFWFVLAWLRINTFENAPFSMKWSCPECHSTNSTKLVLSELQIVELPQEYKEPATITLPNGEELPLRLQRVSDQDKVEAYAKVILNTDSPTPEELYIPSLAITIANGMDLHSNVEMLSEKGKYSAEDLTILSEFQDVYAHGLPRHISAKCGGAGGCDFSVNRLRLEFRIHDTIPANEYRRYIGNNIRFG